MALYERKLGILRIPVLLMISASGFYFFTSIVSLSEDPSVSGRSRILIKIFVFLMLLSGFAAMILNIVRRLI